MSFSNCPHGVRGVKCTICNGGPLCIHGAIKDLCGTCKHFELCEHNRKKIRCILCLKNRIKQCL